MKEDQTAEDASALLPTFAALTDKVEQVLLRFANIPEEILALFSLPPDLA